MATLTVCRPRSLALIGIAVMATYSSPVFVRSHSGAHQGTGDDSSFHASSQWPLETDPAQGWISCSGVVFSPPLKRGDDSIPNVGEQSPARLG